MKFIFLFTLQVNFLPGSVLLRVLTQICLEAERYCKKNDGVDMQIEKLPILTLPSLSSLLPSPCAEMNFTKKEMIVTSH
jgi:hypothetical protein